MPLPMQGGGMGGNTPALMPPGSPDMGQLALATNATVAVPIATLKGFYQSLLRADNAIVSASIQSIRVAYMKFQVSGRIVAY